MLNAHRDVFATTDATGTLISTFYHDPFGNTATDPTNTATDSTYGWMGWYEKTNETGFTLIPTQMGARAYTPILGRFLQVDPVEGGTLNAYAYAHDPVNLNDYGGQCLGPLAIVCAAIVAIPAAIKAAPAVIRAVPTAIRGVTSAVSGVRNLLVRSAPTTQKISSTVNSPTNQRIVPAVTRFVDNGRSMVSSQGFQMTEYYYNKLMDSGRSDFAVRTTKILENYTSKALDPKGFEGFYKYIYDDWYIIYNPTTSELSHLGPLK